MAKNFYGFEKKPSRAITIIEIIIICILALLIAAIVAFNLMFRSDGSAPTMFGYQIYLNQSTTMGDAVPKNSAVLATTDISGLKPKDVVLTKIQAADREYIAILRIQDMQTRDGVNYYLLKGDNSPETEALLVPESAIIAKAEQFNSFLGSVLLFSTSKIGIIIAIVIPCVLIILLQVFKIIKVNRMEEDEEMEEIAAEIELDDNEEVVFSTLREAEKEPQKEPLPVRKMYVDGEGEATFRSKPLPTAQPQDLDRALKNGARSPFSPGPDPYAQAKKNSIPGHFSQKPAAKKPELASELYSEPPKAPAERYDRDYADLYDRPVRKPAYEEPAAPPKVENPVDITIPADAVKPRETIAPPPKQTNNKTVEELMRVIDQAQSGLKK